MGYVTMLVVLFALEAERHDATGLKPCATDMGFMTGLKPCATHRYGV